MPSCITCAANEINKINIVRIQLNVIQCIKNAKHTNGDIKVHKQVNKRKEKQTNKVPFEREGKQV